jgi:hypothetical protein
VDLLVVVLNENFDPVEGVPAGDFTFAVQPHSGYPALGGGPSGDCAGCENEYTVYCLDAATDINGEMNIRVDTGTGCAPSMCCPVEVIVTLPQGAITDPGEVLQNTVDLVANGDVRGPDFSSFGGSYVAGTGGSMEYCIDYVDSGAPWGNITGSDFSMFASHYKDCCGSENEPDPANCDPFTDPCP